MNAIKIHNHGVMLKSASEEDAEPLTNQAFSISLTDNVIESMIKCVQDGGDIHLALGANPTLQYGSESHRISQPEDDHPFDLYLTNPYNTVREATQIPTMSLFRNPRLNKLGRATGPKVGGKAKPSVSSSGSNLDSDIEALHQGMAAHNAAKGRSVLLSGALPANKKAASKIKNNTLSWNSTGNSRSLSTSPALKPVASPLINPSDPSRHVKEQRAPLVHELAVRDHGTDYLKQRWTGKQEDFIPALEKVADYSKDAKTWSLRKNYWKELDVWNYDYDSDDREIAIKNAIKRYDNQRLSASEPEWERLNHKKDRGKGICLSKLQANLAKGPAATAPKIKVQKAEDSSTSTSKDDGEIGHRVELGGESMARSSSNPLPKVKKLTGSEAQAKRLLNPSKAKSSAASATPKSTPKAKAVPPKANGGRGALSQEIIDNSDSSGDEAHLPPSKPKPTAKPKAPVSKPVEKPSQKASESPIERSAPKPKQTALPKITKPAPKRRMEEDDSSSSSGSLPLAQRMKKTKPSATLPSQSYKKRATEMNHTSRESDYNRNKNTSPTKSSPLASSPPTNASEITDDEPTVSKKRKADVDQRAPPAKRRAPKREVSEEVMAQAERFRASYSKYEALHHEISDMRSAIPREKLERLEAMRDRLAQMKKQIYAAYDD